MTTLRTGYLTGPNGYRSTWFGSTQQRRSRVGGGIAVALLLVAILVDPLGGLIVGGVLGGAIMLLVNPTVSGDLLSKVQARRRWNMRVKRGVDRFEPYSDAAWHAAIDSPKKGRLQRLARIRQMPDGAAGMGWLQNSARQVGIAWHEPPDGSTPYLSVAFEVDGRMQGFESLESLNASTQRWGGFLSSLGGDFSLCRYIQVLTRVLPPNTVLHEAWAAEHVDRELAGRGRVGTDLFTSYQQVLDTAAAIGTVQRHFVIARFDLDGDFVARAKRLGEGVVGMRRLMSSEVGSLTRSLSVAGVGRVRPLTARQVAAFIRHAQNPSRELDRVSDVEANHFGVPSHDTRALYVTHDDALGVDGIHWYSATARIEAEQVDAGAKNMFWINGWLVDMPESIVRSMSFHMRVVPARVARAHARSDETVDAAELAALHKSGSVATDDAEAKRFAAAQRAEDMRPGSGYHGIEWMGFVTVTATTPVELERHTRMVAERASTHLGVRRLEWCRDYQSVAAGYTWPIARALTPHKSATFGARIEGAIARMDVDGDMV